jgi:hypothetical protein
MPKTKSLRSEILKMYRMGAAAGYTTDSDDTDSQRNCCISALSFRPSENMPFASIQLEPK